MAIKKPKKVTTAKFTGPTKAVLGKPTFATPKKPAIPTQPAQPAAPVQAPVPQAPAPITVANPLPSFATAMDRQQAVRGYGEGLNEINASIRDLAANYGGASKVLQYGYTPEGGDTQNELDMATNQPGTQLEVLLRNLNANKQNTNDSYLAGGSFFGTQRVGKLNELDQGYAGDLASAQRAFQQAIANYDRQVGVLRGNRNQVLTTADNEDRERVTNTTPEPQVAEAAPTIKPVAVAPRTVARTYTNNHGSKVRQYTDGKKQVLVNGIWKWVK